ncbi:MAG: hypothetical protein A2X56_05460 [Nitrospirae bacterium GWC2_57_13]|jgi:hypothetical protein|nr:MAG: hypothetical protein A2X56_05460 [Nitrospirae bacterium GWC2_57_13]HAS55443.1 hypothetical protein [Nitrospiraceae bacterium]
MDDKKELKENGDEQEVQEKITRRNALKRIALSVGGIGLIAAFPSWEGARAGSDPEERKLLASYYSWYSSYGSYYSSFYSSYYSSYRSYSSNYYSYISYSGVGGPSRGGCLTPKGG